jgi:hypothetical protein
LAGGTADVGGFAAGAAPPPLHPPDHKQALAAKAATSRRVNDDRFTD